MTSFVIHQPSGPGISAVVFDTPHSGVDLPAHFQYACTRQDLMHLHDPHIEKLLAYVPDAGVPVLEALVHRTCIDLNRFEDEINPEIISDGWPHPVRQTRHTAMKLGLFPVMAGPRGNRIAPIYNAAAQLTAAEVQRRITDYHRPYYAALNTLMNTAGGVHGHALHVDVHSYLRRSEYAAMMADMIIGDVNGTTCSPATTQLTAAFLQANGYSVGFNGPDFSGGALINTTTNPDAKYESLQIEIARDLYMNQDTLTYDPVKGEKLARAIEKLAVVLHNAP